jgi:cell filamentation protein
MTMQRSDEPLPPGNLDVNHYCAIHHHLFQDVYEWAGKFRTVRMSKGGSAFYYPEYIEQEMQRLFDDLKHQNYFCELLADEFATRAAHFLAILNAIHPFREGNGRAQTSFLLLLADHAGHPINLDKLVPKRFMDAMIASFGKDEERLVMELKRLVD